MQTDTAQMEEIRASLRAQLPAGAILKRDRGEALLVTDAPAENLSGFRSEHRGPFVCIFPDESWMLRLEDTFPKPPDDLSASLMRFQGGKPDRETILLFIRGLKLLESSARSERIRFDRDVRRHAAVQLRCRAPGGGLYALGILDSLLKT